MVESNFWSFVCGLRATALGGWVLMQLFVEFFAGLWGERSG